MDLVMAILAVTLGASAVQGQQAPAPFRVGAAAVSITPKLDRRVYLAGFQTNRRATGVHDDIYARALVVESQGKRLALVSLDLIGLSNRRVRKYREQIRSVEPANVVIACTHVHSAPDTLGLWGPLPLVSGLDSAYLDQVGAAVKQAVDRAAGNLRPARLYAGVSRIPAGVAKNAREPVLDPDVHVLLFKGDDGRAVATLLHFGCHPEAMMGANTEITADFPAYALTILERELGGTALFFNGALGGMVTPDVRERTFAETRRVGEEVGRAALAAARSAAVVPGDRLSLQRQSIRIPVANEKFRLLNSAGVLDGEVAGDQLATEVSRIDLGQVRMITVPGEILPGPALALKKEIGGPAPLILALGDDEIGYILDPSDFDRELYKYERSMSVGKEAWPRILEAARALLGGTASPK